MAYKPYYALFKLKIKNYIRYGKKSTKITPNGFQTTYLRVLELLIPLRRWPPRASYPSSFFIPHPLSNSPFCFIQGAKCYKHIRRQKNNTIRMLAISYHRDDMLSFNGVTISVSSDVCVAMAYWPWKRIDKKILDAVWIAFVIFHGQEREMSFVWNFATLYLLLI